jgi:hypothetical protein
MVAEQGVVILDRRALWLRDILHGPPAPFQKCKSTIKVPPYIDAPCDPSGLGCAVSVFLPAHSGRSR